MRRFPAAFSFMFVLFSVDAIPQVCATGNPPHPASMPSRAQRDKELDNLYRELMLRHLQEDRQAADITRRHEAEQREKEMIEKATKFATLWRTLFHELGTRGTFNVKTARELSKSFRDLE